VEGGHPRWTSSGASTSTFSPPRQRAPQTRGRGAGAGAEKQTATPGPRAPRAQTRFVRSRRGAGGARGGGADPHRRRRAACRKRVDAALIRRAARAARARRQQGRRAPAPGLAGYSRRAALARAPSVSRGGGAGGVGGPQPQRALGVQRVRALCPQHDLVPPDGARNVERVVARLRRGAPRTLSAAAPRGLGRRKATAGAPPPPMLPLPVSLLYTPSGAN
jgi:hypothetical protein